VKDIQIISVNELYKLQQKDSKLIIVDVRTEEEFEEIRAVGAINLPGSRLSQENLEKIVGLDHTQPIYFICRSGARSLAACRNAAGFGFDHPINVSGGTLGWHDEGLPTTSG
jgi:rhodanese-related sulfurtransferase